MAIHVEQIQRDALWWNSNIPKLKISLLPELASSRQCRGEIT